MSRELLPTPSSSDDDRDVLDELVYAVHRLNVDWDELAKTCGDQKCAGYCEHVATVRRIVTARLGGERS